jgi:hypothetical protein
MIKKSSTMKKISKMMVKTDLKSKLNKENKITMKITNLEAIKIYQKNNLMILKVMKVNLMINSKMDRKFHKKKTFKMSLMKLTNLNSILRKEKRSLNIQNLKILITKSQKIVKNHKSSTKKETEMKLVKIFFTKYYFIRSKLSDYCKTSTIKMFKFKKRLKNIRWIKLNFKEDLSIYFYISIKLLNQSKLFPSF